MTSRKMTNRPNNPPRILVTLSHYVPSVKAGGPVRSIENLVEALGDEYEFRIVTSNHDLRDSNPFPGIVCDTWQRVGKAMVMYVSASQIASLHLLRVFRDTPYDLLYLNGYFPPKWTLLPLAFRKIGLIPTTPVLVAPRGDLTPGSRAIRAKKKRAFLFIEKYLGLFREVRYQATAETEKIDIERTLELFPSGRRSCICIARNLPSFGPRNSGAERRTKQRGCVRIIYLSRIAPVKNLFGALSMLDSLEGAVQFNIYGPIEDETYWNLCLDQIAKLPANVQVDYRGPVEREQVFERFFESDLLLLPTHAENFGHVIVEAMAAGCPLLISDRTPWRDLETAGVGWDLPLEEPDRFREALQRCIDMDPQEHNGMRLRAEEYARILFEKAEGVQEHRDLFQSALSMGSP